MGTSVSPWREAEAEAEWSEHTAVFHPKVRGCRLTLSKPP